MAEKIMLESGINELEVLEFLVGDHHYGINVAKIQEIISWHPVTPMPNTHEYVEGIFMPRDKMISVIDLRRCLGFEPHKVGEKSGLFFITNFSGLSTAFHIDEVLRIHRVSWENVHLPDTTAAAGEADLATGAVQIEGHLTVIIDFERIVSTINPETAIKVSEMEEYQARRDRSRSPILLAEDSRMLSKLIKGCLNQAGYTNVITNVNGQEAWDQLCAFDSNGNVLDKVHCIITDIEMPQMDGHMLTKQVKDHPVMKNIPVIIFSSIINDVVYKKGKDVGADAQLSKPEIGKLVELVDGLVEKYEEERAGG